MYDWSWNNFCSASEDIKHPPVGFFDGAKLHKGHFVLSLPSFEAAPYPPRLKKKSRNTKKNRLTSLKLVKTNIINVITLTTKRKINPNLNLRTDGLPLK